MATSARALWQGPHAAHDQHHHRSLTHRRHRAGDGTRGARAAAHAHPGGPGMSAAGGVSPSEHKGELRVVGTSVAREVDLLLEGVAALVGKRAPRVLQVGARALLSDRNERNWRKLVAKRFGERARFVGIDLLEGTNVDSVLDICGSPKQLKLK